MKKGFTLIELLAVIVILAIILAISVPLVLKVIRDSRIGAMESDAKIVLNAIKQKEVLDDTFDPLYYNANLENLLYVLSITSINYNNIFLSIKDDELFISIKGKEKYDGLTACGTFHNMKVVEGDCDPDVMAPVITLNGSPIIEIKQGTEYIELGATAIDNKDENVPVIITGDVDMNNVSEYKVTYTATDAAGNTATSTRKVKVVTTIVYSGPEFVSSKNVNGPVLATGMIPIKWNGTDWIASTINDPEWYDYDEKKWANAMTKDGSMWVWIPRYAYQIMDNYHKSIVGTINIKFLISNTNNTTDGTKLSPSPNYSGSKQINYVLHPAFKFGNNQITGIWVSKFEPSVSDITNNCYITQNATNCDVNTLIPKIVPNVFSWRSISVGKAFDVSLSMKNKTNIYGWNSNEIDTHMMKNDEWGSIAYLSKSIYGKYDIEIWKNSSSSYITGCSGSNSNSDGASGCNYTYSTSNGQQASTTGNVYGIYDMVGGAYEYLAAYVDNNSLDLASNGSNILDSDLKHKNIYAKGKNNTSESNYEANASVYGDAQYETSSSSIGGNSWYGDDSIMPDTSPWYIRGGYYDTTTTAGIFGFDNDSGKSTQSKTFRPILLVGSDL